MIVFVTYFAYLGSHYFFFKRQLRLMCGSIAHIQNHSNMLNRESCLTVNFYSYYFIVYKTSFRLLVTLFIN